MIVAIIVLIVGAGIGGYVGFRCGQKSPDEHTLRTVRNEAAKRVLAEFNGEWTYKTVHGVLEVELVRPHAKMVVVARPPDDAEPGERVRIQMGADLPYDAIVNSRMRLGEVLRLNWSNRDRTREAA